MNTTRDWNRKGSSCGGVLGQLSHEVLVQHCFSSGLRLNDNTSNLFLTIVITLHLFKVIKYYWKARDKRSKSVLLVLPPDTTENNPTSIIHHQSCHFLWFFILCATEFLARQSQRFFLKHNSTYLQDNEKSNYVVWPAPSSKFLKMARGPKSLATPEIGYCYGFVTKPWYAIVETNLFASEKSVFNCMEIDTVHKRHTISPDGTRRLSVCKQSRSCLSGKYPRMRNDKWTIEYCTSQLFHPHQCEASLNTG